MSTSTKSQQRSPILLVALVIGTLVGGLISVGMIQRWRTHAVSKNELRVLLAELDENEPGWRLADIEAAREVVPLEENSARVITVIGPLMPFIEPRFGSESLRTNERLPDTWFERPRKMLGKGKDLIPEARRLADLPRGRFDVVVDHTTVIRIQFPHHGHFDLVGTLLLLDAEELAHAGNVRGALLSCRAAMNAARSCGDEPVLWAHHRRCHLSINAANVGMHSLALGVADEKTLEALQRLAAQELSYNGTLHAWRGHRASMGALFEGLAEGTLRSRNLPDRGGGAVIRYLVFDPQVPKENVAMMRLATRIVDNARLPLHEQAAGEKLLDKELDPGTRTLRLVNDFFIHPSSIGGAQRMRNATLGCLVVLLAAERYRLKHDKWPERIDDLMPDFLTEVPTDPFDGKPLRFKRLPDGVAVYSVGQDGTDDGGSLGVRGVPGSRKDHGYRLWDVDKRNQPAPAPKAKK